MKPPLRILDGFAGIGGFSYAAHKIVGGFETTQFIEIDKYLRDKKSNILLQVHDEIICEIHDSEIETTPFIIKDLLEENSLDIPLTVDMETCSPSWATKKNFRLPTLEDCIDWTEKKSDFTAYIDWN